MTERYSARPLSELDQATRARIEHLMGQDPETLHIDDRVFLNARREYLTEDQRADYLEAAPNETTEPAKPRGRRKKAE